MPRTDRTLLATLAITALAPMSWGSTYAVTTQFLPDGRPLFTGLVRALPAGLVLVVTTRVRPHGVWWWRSTALGALYIGIFMPLLFVSAYRLPGGVASTLGSVGPLVTLALAAAFLSERPTLRKAIAGLAGIVGVALVVLQADARIDTLGLVAGLAGTISMAAANVLTKRWGRPPGVGGLTFIGWQLTAGGLMIVPVALLVEGAPPALDGRNVVGYVYLASVNTVLAYSLWFRGLAKLPANSVAFLGLTGPITAATIGWVALDQPLSLLQLLGMAIAFTGTMLGALQIAQRSADAQTKAVGVPFHHANATARPPLSRADFGRV
jgi:probable blue pigment (indigoidine) exporter